jgi:hypothetical protein
MDWVGVGGVRVVTFKDCRLAVGGVVTKLTNTILADGVGVLDVCMCGWVGEAVVTFTH